MLSYPEDTAGGLMNPDMVTVRANVSLDVFLINPFVGPAQVVDGLFFPGYSAADANPDIGDSAIMETAGIGGFAMAAAPAIVQFVGGSAEDALATTRRMGRITVGKNPVWAIPALGFVGSPTGIDVRKVNEHSLLPAINAGWATDADRPAGDRVGIGDFQSRVARKGGEGGGGQGDGLGQLQLDDVEVRVRGVGHQGNTGLHVVHGVALPQRKSEARRAGRDGTEPLLRGLGQCRRKILVVQRQ